jgi:hypothetical protein
VAAAAAANVRNALMLEIAGEVRSAVDYWRRHETTGAPLPVNFRQITAPPMPAPWMRPPTPAEPV